MQASTRRRTCNSEHFHSVGTLTIEGVNPDLGEEIRQLLSPHN